MTKKEIYNGIKTRIEELSGVKHVSLWNNQTNPDREKNEIPINFPAVFVEFEFLNYTNEDSDGCQKTDEVLIKLHIVQENYTWNDDEYLDFVDTVSKKIHLYTYTDANDIDVKFVRLSEEQDTDHDQLIHWMVTFQATKYWDTSLNQRADWVDSSPINMDVQRPDIVDEL